MKKSNHMKEICDLKKIFILILEYVIFLFLFFLWLKSGIVISTFFMKSLKLQFLILNIGALFGVVIFNLVYWVLKSPENKKKDRWIFWGFVCGLFITILLVFHNFLMGRYSYVFCDVGSDTWQQYYPYYLNVVRRIKEGSFGIWNWDYGLGTSIINNISQTLDPFGIFVISGGILFGAEKVKLLLIIAQVLKITISAFLCRYYLKIFDVSEMAACVGGYLYAFNGYIMLWGQHYMLGTGCVYLLLILIVIEKTVRDNSKKNYITLAISVCASMIYSYYNSYMILLFAGIYFLLRVFEPGRFETWKECGKKMLSTLFSVIIGLLMSGVIFLPSAGYLLFSSSRLESDGSALGRFIEGVCSAYSKESVGALLSRTLSNNLLCINQNENLQGYWGNYYELPQLSLTIFFFLMLSQFVVVLIIRENNRKIQIYRIVWSVVIIVVVLNRGMAIAFNGFAYAQARYMFVVIPCLALMIAVVWDECILKAQISGIGLLAGIMLSFVVLGYSYISSSEEVRKHIILTACFIFLFSVIIYIYMKWKNVRTIGILAMVGLILVSTANDAFITNNWRSCMTPELENLTFADGVPANNTIEALQFIQEQDNSFFRVDKLYVDSSIFGDSLIEGYSPVTDYNSTINNNLLQFYEQLYPNAILPVANGAQRAVKIDEKKDLIALKLINLKYLLCNEQLDNDNFEYITKIGSVLVYRNVLADSIAHWYTKTISKDQYETLGDKEKEKIVNDTLIVEKEHDILDYDGRDDTEIGDFLLEKSSSICGNVSCSQRGILMLAIPDQQGWIILVDGEEREIVNADYGFVGVELTEGEHEIEVRYEIPYLKQGMGISIIGLLLLGLWGSYPLYRGKLRKSTSTSISNRH